VSVPSEEATTLAAAETEAAAVTARATARERDVTATLVRLADSLVEDFDLVDVLDELANDCVRLLDVTAAGLLLAGPHGELHVVAASSEQTRLLELFQLQRKQGPCVDCYRTGEAVSVPDLGSQATRWPLFADAALSTGYRSVHALPLRLRQEVLGALNLFSAETGELGDAATSLGQALADMATITILQERAMRQSEQVAAQLQVALLSRVVLEQAKGVLAERGELEMDDAFKALRGYARNRNQRLHEVSQGIVDGSIDAGAVLGSALPPER
jgi:transcriptional regulator with GAF, ATPase, and Fis domain